MLVLQLAVLSGQRLLRTTNSSKDCRTPYTDIGDLLLLYNSTGTVQISHLNINSIMMTSVSNLEGE